MAEPYDSLVREIDRIAASPYPTQLKGLRDVVCTRCNCADVARWAISRPCQIGRLAECLLEGLRYWPYVLELITKLSDETAIRDAILQRSPSLLHDIVSYATKASSLDSQYVVAAVTMLSHPLPEHVTMPAEAQTLFIRLFDQAADEPTLPNIRRVYKILHGTSSLLLGLLSSSSLFRLEQHLFAIIKNIKGENQSLSLYCLAIMKAMCSSSADEFRLSNSQYDTQELLASTELTSASKWTSDSIQQFFTDGKAQKTVQLVVLRAMWACTTSTGEPFNERLESLLLANEVISAVPPHLRETWRKANSLIVGKLQDKVMMSTLETELKFQGLCFLAQVAEGSRVPATVIDELRHLVADPQRLQQALSGVAVTQLEHLMEAGVFDEDTTTKFLQHAVDFATGSDNADWLLSSRCLRTMLEKIYQSMASDSKLSEGSMLALDVIACGQTLHKLIHLAGPRYSLGEEAKEEACGAAMSDARNGLIHSLCKVFLRAALSSTHQSYAASQDTLSALLALHATSAPTSSKCTHGAKRVREMSGSFAFVEANGSPEDDSLDWRAAMEQHLQSHARRGEHDLKAIFARACASLEARCEDVEAPLREERERYEGLYCKYSDLEQSFARLEAENADRSVRFNAVEMERDQCLGDMEAQREEIEGHERRIEYLLQTLQRTQAESERLLEDAKAKSNAASLEHDARMARKDEDFEDLQSDMDELRRHVGEKTAHLDALQKDMEQAHRSLQNVKGELADVHRLDKEHQDLISRLRQEKDGVLEQRDRISSELQEAQQDAKAQREAFERDLNDLRQHAQDNLAKAAGDHEDRLADLTRQYETNANTLRKQLAEVHDEVGQAREQHRADIEQWESEIAERQKKIDRLTRKCSDKHKQIAEANSMRTNLMAAMGLGGAQAQAQALPHRPSRSSATQRTRAHEPDSQEDPSPATPFSGDDSQQLPADTSFASNATSSGESRSGPTPKRPRSSRQSVKPRSPPKPPTSRLGVSARSGARNTMAASKSAVKIRQPLLGVSVNAGREGGKGRVSMVRTPGKGFGLGISGVGDGEEEEFGGSEIFGGTQGVEGMDLGEELDAETEVGSGFG